MLIGCGGLKDAGQLFEFLQYFKNCVISNRKVLSKLQIKYLFQIITLLAYFFKAQSESKKLTLKVVGPIAVLPRFSE